MNLSNRLASLVFLSMLALITVGCSTVDCLVNRVSPRFPPPHDAQVSQEAKDLHKELVIADAHCDALMWRRDLSKWNALGHVDLPRLRMGNVAVQMFTTVGRTAPRGWDPVSAVFDGQIALAIAQLQPPATWFSPYHRAMCQRSRLMKLLKASDGIRLVTNRRALDEIVAQRPDGPIGALLGIEGAFALEGKLERVKTFADAGFRMLSLTHYADTRAGGASEGFCRNGLTPFGRSVALEMERHGILLDLAHASPDLIDEVLDLYETGWLTKPPIVSHTGVKRISWDDRNLGDCHIIGIAKVGGVICVGYFKPALPDLDPELIGRSIRHIVSVCNRAGLDGTDHVGLGSDFDGFVQTPFDTTGLIRITENLLHGSPPFTPDQVKKIMGLNTIRVLRLALPEP